MALTECRTIEHSAEYLDPAPLSRVEPGATDFFEGDLSEDADCLGAGVTILTAVPSIRTEDDDSLLTFGIVSINGLEYRVFYTVDPTQTQHIYGVLMTIGTSDNRTLLRWHSIPIIPTRFNYQNPA